MTGALTYAVATDHVDDLRRAAKERRGDGQKKRPLPRRPLLPGLRRPRHALAF